MGFIPIDKFTKLREASKAGDLRAKDVLDKYLNGSDYAADLDAYFKPVEAPAPTKVIENQGNPGSEQEAKATTGTGNPKLDQFLADNGIKEGDLEYEDAIEDYFNEFPEERTEIKKVNNKVDDKPEQVDEPVDDKVNEEQKEEMKEATKDLSQKLFEVISECDSKMLEIMQNPDIDDNAKKGAMTSLQEIKQSMVDNIEKMKKVQKLFDKNEEEPLQ